MDEYESFMNDYVDFMKEYTESGSPASMLTEYLALMEDYSEYINSIDEYDPDEMSVADAQYYLEVTTRVSEKLLEVAE